MFRSMYVFILYIQCYIQWLQWLQWMFSGISMNVFTFKIVNGMLRFGGAILPTVHINKTLIEIIKLSVFMWCTTTVPSLGHWINQTMCMYTNTKKSNNKTGLNIVIAK